jgi:hypothetical protein
MGTGIGILNDHDNDDGLSGFVQKGRALLGRIMGLTEQNTRERTRKKNRRHKDRIVGGEAHGMLKYSGIPPKKDDWDAADHLARFHCKVKNINIRSREGVFFGKIGQTTLWIRLSGPSRAGSSKSTHHRSSISHMAGQQSWEPDGNVHT